VASFVLIFNAYFAACLVISENFFVRLMCLGWFIFSDFYCVYADQIKEEVGGARGSMEEGRNLYRVLMGKPEGKRQLEKPKPSWEDGINMDLREIGWECVDWIHLPQDRDR
jgi:hypothetical protein